MEMSPGHPCCANGNSCCPKHGKFAAQCFCLAGTRKRVIEEMPEQRCDASRLIGRRLTTTGTSDACEKQYRRKARPASRLSLKPENVVVVTTASASCPLVKARKSRRSVTGNFRPRNDVLRRGLPPPAPRPTEVRGMFRPIRHRSTLTPDEAQTASAARPTHYTQAHHGGFRYGDNGLALR